MDAQDTSTNKFLDNNPPVIAHPKPSPEDFCVKVLPTIYNGTKFRSRTEARWAVFFDGVGLPFQYEYEGYDLNGIYYLPDFWLPELDAWVEIKGTEPTKEETEKAQLLANATKKRVYIFFGILPDYDSSTYSESGYVNFPSDGGWDNYQHWCQCGHCKKISIQYCGYSNRVVCCDENRKEPGWRYNYREDIDTALDKARTWRFY